MTFLKQIRWYHLLLAMLATAAYLTGDEDSRVHRLVGYTVAAAVIVRLLLAAFGVGAFGWRRLVPPRRAPAAQAGLRHPAISRVLILLILGAVAGTATTGVLMDQGASLTRPGLILAESENERHESATEEEDDDEGEGGEDGILGEVHALFANLIILLVALHISYLVVFRLPMAKFMIFWPTGTGRRQN
jgi:cytochrome b